VGLTQGCEPVKVFLFQKYNLSMGYHGIITGLCQILTVGHAG
jgi:hypothetical protein